MNWQAVITGDIIGSQKLTVPQRELLEESLWHWLDMLAGDREHYSITRGDSFQILLERPEEALSKALRLRGWVKALQARNHHPLSDVRLSIGLGSVTVRGKAISSSDGTAFFHSGHGLDYLKKEERRLLVSTGNSWHDQTWNTVCLLADAFITHWTYLQAQAMVHRMEGKTFKEMVSHMDKAESTVYQYYKAAHGHEIMALLNYYSNFVEHLKAEE